MSSPTIRQADNPAPSQTTASKPIDRAAYRAARRFCRKHTRDLFFASHFLPRARRFEAFCLFAVWKQLVDIMTPARNDDAAPAHSFAASERQHEPCDQETPQRRRQVCSAVLDHLYQGLETGRPELDGFQQVRAAHDLPRQLFETLCDGLFEELTTRRFATWKRLHQTLSRSGGSAALLAARLLMHNPAEALNDTVTAQVQAWGAATRLASIVQRVGDDWRAGRLLLPLDDLTRFGLSEADIARFTDAGATAGDARWRQLMDHLTGRVWNLFRGGARALSALANDGSRRAAAVMGVLAADPLQRLMQSGADPFATRITTGTLRRLTRMPKVVRLVVDPTAAADVFV